MHARTNFCMSLCASLALLAGCAGGDGGAASAQTNEPPPAAVRANQNEELAPIESAEVQVRESFPPQYALRIVSGLPSGCARFSRIEVARQDAVIDVTVWNSMPTDPNVACTMIYGAAENTAELGSDFISGETYEVRVNGEPRTSFTAQ